jgi:3D (Asp-Asp-Asp) domain-containing protein
MSNKVRNIGLAAGILILYVVPSLVTEAQVAPGTVNTPTTSTTAAITATTTVPIPEILHLVITAYASVPDETSDHPFITASGNLVRDGIVATNLLPFGTKVMIPSLFGNKVFTVEDRMNRKFNTRMDIWMPTVAGAVVFGIHTADVVVLPPGQASSTDQSLAIADSK